MHAYRGSGVCANSLLMARGILETKLLAGLQERVLHPDVIDYMLRGLEMELRRSAERTPDDEEELRNHETRLKREIGNLTRAVVDATQYSAALTEEVVRAERELANVQRRLRGTHSPDAVRTLEVNRLRKFAFDRLANLRGMLSSEPATARAAIARHVQRITLTPTGKTYVAAGSWDLLGRGCYDGAGGLACT